MGAINVTEKNFNEEVMRSNIPVLVDFGADWCGPCRMISPIIDQLADELVGKLKVAKVNVDESQELAARFNVMSIPNLLIIKKGEVIDQMTGAMSKEQLLLKLSPALNS